MPDFAYVGLDTAGRERRGSVRAETRERRARSSSRASSMSCGSSRREGAAPPLLSRGLFARRRMSAEAAHPVHPPARHPDHGRPLEEALRTISPPGRARGGAARARHGPCRRGRGAAALRRDGARAGQLSAALPGDGRGRRGLGHAAADPRAARRLLERQAQVRCKVLSTLAYPVVLARRCLRGVRADDLRGAEGGRAVRGCRPAAAAADPDGDRPFQFPRGLVVGAADPVAAGRACSAGGR